MNAQQTMNAEQTTTISLKDLWNIFVHRLWIMLLVAVLAVAGAWSVITLTYKPQYESTALLYILKQNDDSSSSSSSSSDFDLALKVLSDCDYLLKSHSVIDEVIDKLSLSTDYKALSASVSTSNPNNSRVLEVKVTADTPEEAKRIVDCLCEIGAEKIEEAMGFKQVNFYEYGTFNENPCNKTGITTYLLIALAAMVLVYVIFVAAFIFDDRIRTDEDIQRYLGLAVLGDFPEAHETKRHGYGYYAPYGGKKEGEGK